RVLVRVGHHVLQTLQLQLLKLGPRHAFYFRIVVLLIVGNVLCHGCSLFACVPVATCAAPRRVWRWSAPCEAPVCTGTRAQSSVLHETTNPPRTQPSRSFDVLMLCYRKNR